MIRSKKGIVEMSLQQTIGLVLAVLFIILSVIVIMGLINVFTAGPDTGSIATFNEVFDAAEVLLSPENTNLSQSCKITNRYLDPSFAIVGFNKKAISNQARETGDEGDDDYGYVEEYCGTTDNNIYKPSSCLDRACLCLCKGGMGDITGDDCKESGAQCKRLDAGFQDFIMTNPTKNNKKIDLVIYGESCWLGSDLKVIPGYILKLQTKTRIEINPILSQTVMQSEYGDIPECKDLIKKLRQPAAAAAKPAESTAKPEGSSLDEAMEKQNAKTPTLK
ncbi:MAG: hypothetical protein V1729_01800 [Candidatus Woesearchaeota archaeon]